MLYSGRKLIRHSSGGVGGRRIPRVVTVFRSMKACLTMFLGELKHTCIEVENSTSSSLLRCWS